MYYTWKCRCGEKVGKKDQLSWTALTTTLRAHFESCGKSIRIKQRKDKAEKSKD